MDNEKKINQEDKYYVPENVNEISPFEKFQLENYGDCIKPSGMDGHREIFEENRMGRFDAWYRRKSEIEFLRHSEIF